TISRLKSASCSVAEPSDAHVPPWMVSKMGRLLHSGSEERPPALPQKIGRYRVLDLLGEGGAGVVFRAKDEELGREVALKTLKTAQTFSRTQVERFEREERNAARLRHPSIVTIYEIGRDADVLYYTMELVSGRPFDTRSGDLLKRVRILEKTARAVQYAHEQGV